MPRIKQREAVYAAEDFRKEVRQKQGFYDLMSTSSLAEHIGIPRSTLGGKLKNPEKCSVEDLQKLIAGLRLDPVVVLRLLGYSAADIKNFKDSGKSVVSSARSST